MPRESTLDVQLCMVCGTPMPGARACPVCWPRCACGKPGVKVRYATGEPKCAACISESNASSGAFVSFQEWKTRYGSLASQ